HARPRVRLSRRERRRGRIPVLPPGRHDGRCVLHTASIGNEFRRPAASAPPRGGDRDRRANWLPALGRAPARLRSDRVLPDVACRPGAGCAPYWPFCFFQSLVHTRLVIALGVTWVLDGFVITVASLVGQGGAL